MILLPEEWVMIYDALFNSENGVLSDQDSDPYYFLDNFSKSQLASLEKVIAYFDNVLSRRSNRLLPISIRITFAILSYIQRKMKIVSQISDFSTYELFENMLLMERGGLAFRLLNQMVDQGQNGQFAGSFSKTLELMGFREFSFISQMRHNLTHQEAPNKKNLEMCLVIILKELKRLYWDVQAKLYIEMKIMQEPPKPKSKKKNPSKENPNQTLQRAVNCEYFDLLNVQNNFTGFVNSECSKKENKDGASQSFTRNHLKKLHRKSFMVAYLFEKVLSTLTQNVTNINTVELEQTMLPDISVIASIIDSLSSNKESLEEILRGHTAKMDQIICLCKIIGGLHKVDEVIKRAKQYIDSSNNLDPVLGKRKHPTMNDETAIQKREGKGIKIGIKLAKWLKSNKVFENMMKFQDNTAKSNEWEISGAFSHEIN